MGILQRAVSMKAVLASLTSDAWYAYAAGEMGLSPRARFKWSEHAELLFEGYLRGKVAFDPLTDLNPNAVVQGADRGASGWYFSSRDAGDATCSPALMQFRLAVDPEYAHGYLVFDLPHDIATAHQAARPTAIDLTVMPEGKLNPRGEETVGRTAPLKRGQKVVREVVVAPVPMSSMSKITYVRGGSR